MPRIEELGSRFLMQYLCSKLCSISKGSVVLFLKVKELSILRLFVTHRRGVVDVLRVALLQSACVP